jgi:hypothetical protein
MGWRQFKLNGTDLILYIAQYVMMSKGMQIPTKDIPRSLPIYVRANFTYPNGMRPIVEIQMKLNETERISEAEKKYNMNMICRKWWMSVVLNRNFDHEAQYKNISDTMLQEHINNKCADFKMLSDEQVKGLTKGEHKIDVNDTTRMPPGGKDGDGQGGKKKDPLEGKNLMDFGIRDLLNALKKGKASRAGATGNYCFTQLHVILNRRGENNYGDYLHSGCLDPTQPPSGKDSKPVESQGQVSFAQRGIHEVMRDRNAREFMNDQQLMNPLD